MDWKSELVDTDLPNGVQAIIPIGDYELSIVKSDFSYGGDQGLWEIGVFKDAGMVELPGITVEGDTIKGYLTEDDVDDIIAKMQNL